MPLIKGTLDVLVLKTLSWRPMHGFEIIRWVEDRSQGQFGIENAALLQALHRLEERRLVTGAWGVTENNRRARYYSLTQTGRVALKQESDTWRDAVAALSAVLSAKSPTLRGSDV
jgi:PadR family transcriptional regulator, regulatory protein PadR